MPQNHHQRQSYWHVRVQPRTPQLDGHARSVHSDIRQFGLSHIDGVRSSKIYLLAGTLTESDVQLIAEQLLTDPVSETFVLGRGLSGRDDTDPSIEIQPLPGVMNPTALSTFHAIQRLFQFSASRATIDVVQTARRYNIVGAKNVHDLEKIASGVLANDCIETWYIQGFDRSDTIRDDFPIPPQSTFSIRHVSIRSYDDDALIKLSREAHLFLSLDEMKTIQDYYIKLDRDPTDLELETLAQTWSEHCVHKTLKSAIDYRGDDFGKDGSVEVHFDNLLNNTIVQVTTSLDRDWCLSVFVDNAGVIAFDDEFGIAFKAETHNHPSAIEPYGGAATGIGGCIRDIMGCGLGAKPIASTDVFCLAPPDFDHDRLPGDVLHPRRVLKGVVGGVRDYGNRMGIPTVNGAIYFDERYLGNPLVFCGCIGLIPRDRIEKKPNTGDFIVVVGGRTGRDGIHGATFSSAELTETHADEFSHAVQIGNAIEEKKVLDAMLIARDHPDGCLYSSVTDCGAGGLSSAVGEMGEQLGACVDLEKVPLKYAGLRYDEIWISEAQERMVFAVPPNKLDVFLSIFEAEDVEATVIGNFTDDQRLIVRYENETVGELNMKFLHDGFPQLTRRATWTSNLSTTKPEPRASARADTPTTITSNQQLLHELSQYNTASKEWVIRQYDHEVQGRSVIKPLVGPGFGPSDAAVIRPRYESTRGIAIGCGLCPELTEIDPYIMAIAAIDEAMRNVICVGVDPTRTAILDNFCWPKVDTEESLGALVRTCCGARDAALAYGLPFVSGKDSLNNEFSMSESESKRTGLPQQLAIPGTLLISAMGIVEDVGRCVTIDFKQPGNVIVVASAPVIDIPRITGDSDHRGKNKEPSLKKAYALHVQVSQLIRNGQVLAAHDVSDGGLAVAIAEMCIASRLGAIIKMNRELYAHSLFAPVATTYVLEMSQADAKTARLPIIGKVIDESRLSIVSDKSDSIDVAVADLDRAWRSPLAMDSVN